MLAEFRESGRLIETLPDGYREKIVSFGGGASSSYIVSMPAVRL